MSLDVIALRKQFPILSREIDGKPLIYLDNAATTQKPQAVLDAIFDYYTHCNSNVHRGAHMLADEATRRYEAARDKVAEFINASHSKEVIWTSGTTESINIVANGAKQRFGKGDDIVVTEMEHHANLVTWQQVCEVSGATLKVAPINDSAELDIAAFQDLLSPKTKLVALPHISNALGTINPLNEIIPMVKAVGALVMVDGAQGIAHGHANADGVHANVDVQALDCDFYAFSGHKFFAPTGVGVLWGKESVLADWPVWQTGGEMISEVTYQTASWGGLPNRLEAGTPNIAGAVGLGAAVDWFCGLDINAVHEHEKQLIQKAVDTAADIDGLKIMGNAQHKIGVFSFVIEGTHPADIGFLLDKQGIAIRTGDHCAQPLMSRLDVPGTARASFSIYNTLDEVDALFSALQKVKMMLM